MSTHSFSIDTAKSEAKEAPASAPAAEFGSNALNGLLLDGLTGTVQADGGLWLESETFVGGIPAATVAAGKGALALYEAQLAMANTAAEDAVPAMDAADRAASALSTYDDEGFGLEAGEVVDRVGAMESVCDGWDPDTLGDYWWVEGADEAEAAAVLGHEALAEAYDGALSYIGPTLVLPGTAADASFAEHRTIEVKRRRDHLQPIADAARALIGEAPSLRPRRKVIDELQASWFAGLEARWERQYLLDGLGEGGADPRVLARLARDLDLDLPEAVRALFGGDAADLDAAWDEEGIRHWGDVDDSAFGQDLVVGLLDWEAKDAAGDIDAEDLDRFEVLVQNARDTAYTRFRVPDLGGDGLSHALAAVSDLCEAGKDGDVLTATAALPRAEAALDAVVERYAHVEGAESTLERIRAHRDELSTQLGEERAADLLIGAYAVDEDAPLASVDEQAYFRALKTAAVNARQAYFEMAKTAAESAGKGLDAVGGKSHELFAPEAASAKVPMAFGKVGLAYISLLAEANDFGEMLAALGEDPKKTGLQEGADFAVGLAKFAQSIGEQVTAFVEGMLRFEALRLERAGMNAGKVLEAADALAKSAGKVFAVAGLCIAAVELIRAIRSGDVDRMVAAGAGFANAGVSTAAAFGLIGSQAAGILNIFVFEAVAAYHIAKGLPEIAAAGHRIDVKKHSQVVVDHARAGVRGASRAQAASRAWQATVLTQPKLAAVLEERMGEALVASWNGIAAASLAALDAPAGLDEAFAAHVTRGDLEAHAPPKRFDGRNLHGWLADYTDFVQKVRYGIEDMTDQAMLDIGELSLGGYYARTIERSRDRDAAR